MLVVDSPGNGTVFFVITFSPGEIYVGSCGIALNSTTRRHPRLGLGGFAINFTYLRSLFC